MLFLKYFLKLGASDHIVMAQIAECNIFPDVVFHISNDTLIDSGIIFQIHKLADRYSHGRRRISPDHIDQHLFKINSDQLLRTKQKIFFLFHLFCIRIIQRGFDTAACLGNQHSHEISLRIRKFQQFFLKEFHTWRIAFKRNYHNIRSGISYGNKVMKFIWSVKDELSACQMVDTVICLYFCLSLIYTLKFPEIMAFSCKVKITFVFKIVDCINPVNMNIFFQIHTLKSHYCHLPQPVRKLQYGCYVQVYNKNR